jgi:hypothetical protein
MSLNCNVKKEEEKKKNTIRNRAPTYFHENYPDAKVDRAQLLS